jgi:hypothetical protein
MACGITDPLGCVGGLVGSAASSAWDSICLSFATAADALLKTFARAFTALPPVDLTSPGVKNVYAICLGIAAVIAVLLLLGQVIRTAVTHDGTALAEGLTGIGKAAAAFALTLVIASAAVTAADSLTTYIVNASFGSATQLDARITTLLSFAGQAGHPAAEIAGGASMLLLLSLTGIILILVLWFELLLRNAAIAVLIATSPIAAAGLTSAPSRNWWPRTASAAGQLIIVKPVIALVFALGLELTGTGHDIETLLEGMLILLLAVVAWPVIARFLTFTSIAPGAGGLGLALGFAAGRLSAGGGRIPGGTGAGEAAEGGAAGAESGAVAAGGAAGGPAAAGVLALAAAGIQAAHKASTALAGRMDQVAGHAGLAPAGYPAGQPPASARASGAGPSGRTPAPAGAAGEPATARESAASASAGTPAWDSSARPGPAGDQPAPAGAAGTSWLTGDSASPQPGQDWPWGGTAAQAPEPSAEPPAAENPPPAPEAPPPEPPAIREPGPLPAGPQDPEQPPRPGPPGSPAIPAARPGHRRRDRAAGPARRAARLSQAAATERNSRRCPSTLRPGRGATWGGSRRRSRLSSACPASGRRRWPDRCCARSGRWPPPGPPTARRAGPPR